MKLPFLLIPSDISIVWSESFSLNGLRISSAKLFAAASIGNKPCTVLHSTEKVFDFVQNTGFSVFNATDKSW